MLPHPHRWEAMSFKQQLCGPAWVHSKASKYLVFKGLPGSISPLVCETTTFSPQSQKEIKSAVNTYLALSPAGNCSEDLHGPVGVWDVSRVTGMSHIFVVTNFNDNISKWDVSRVTEMSHMFWAVRLLNGDVSGTCQVSLI